MKRHRVWSVLLVLLTIGAAGVVGADPEGRRTPQPQRRGQADPELRLTGRVVEIHAPRVFTVRSAGDEPRELLVVSPRPMKGGFVGATVTVEGTLRRLSAADVQRVVGMGEIDRQTRERLGRDPALVAHSVLAIGRSETLPSAVEPPPAPPEGPQPVPRLLARRYQVAQRPMTIRTSMMVANLEVFAGRELRVLNGRVVGVLEPSAFLIEPATPYLKRMGQRDRVVVLMRSAALRAPAELIVGSIVTVTGIARTLVGIQVSREAPWPARLSPQAVDRLEVRAVILATSVQTPDGVELTTGEGRREKD